MPTRKRMSSMENELKADYMIKRSINKSTFTKEGYKERWITLDKEYLRYLDGTLKVSLYNWQYKYYVKILRSSKEKFSSYFCKLWLLLFKLMYQHLLVIINMLKGWPGYKYDGMGLQLKNVCFSSMFMAVGTFFTL